MRKCIRQLLLILDGSPSPTVFSQRGQSVVELALVTPLLIVLFAGLVEIGWLANNYLNLLDVTRVGARYGTVQSGNTSPLNWDNDASLALAVYSDPGIYAAQTNFRNCSSTNSRDFGFYNVLMCTMIRSMTPLEIRENGIDDIVISAFALARIRGNELNASKAVNDGDWQIAVVGRFPTNTNECDTNSGNVARVEDLRDPFDFNNVANGISGKELDYFNGIAVQVPGFVGYDTAREIQRGFAYLGQHRVSDNSDCFGSEWTVQEVEALMNLRVGVSGTTFGITGTQRQYIPNSGMVLVEVFWQHNTLLDLPVFSFIGDNILVQVWAAFPVPAVEPTIN